MFRNLKNSSETKFQNSIKSVKFLLDKEIQFFVHVKPFNFVLWTNKLELGRINRNTRTGNVKISKPSEKCQKISIFNSKKIKQCFSINEIFISKTDIFAWNPHFRTYFSPKRHVFFKKMVFFCQKSAYLCLKWTFIAKNGSFMSKMDQFMSKMGFFVENELY